jgi:hypothetical protein
MATAALSSTQRVFGQFTETSCDDPTGRAYRTKTSFVAVHFDEAGKGRIDFLPKDAELRVIGPSPLLPEGFEVKVDHRIHHVFEADLICRSSRVESSRAKRASVGARA